MLKITFETLSGEKFEVEIPKGSKVRDALLALRQKNQIDPNQFYVCCDQRQLFDNDPITEESIRDKTLILYDTSRFRDKSFPRVDSSFPFEFSRYDDWSPMKSLLQNENGLRFANASEILNMEQMFLNGAATPQLLRILNRYRMPNSTPSDEIDLDMFTSDNEDEIVDPNQPQNITDSQNIEFPELYEETPLIYYEPRIDFGDPIDLESAEQLHNLTPFGYFPAGRRNHSFARDIQQPVMRFTDPFFSRRRMTNHPVLRVPSDFGLENNFVLPDNFEIDDEMVLPNYDLEYEQPEFDDNSFEEEQNPEPDRSTEPDQNQERNQEQEPNQQQEQDQQQEQNPNPPPQFNEIQNPASFLNAMISQLGFPARTDMGHRQQGGVNDLIQQLAEIGMPIDNVNLDEHDNEVIRRLMSYGYDLMTVAQVYLSCDKNEDTTLSCLMSM